MNAVKEKSAVAAAAWEAWEAVWKDYGATVSVDLISMKMK